MQAEIREHLIDRLVPIFGQPRNAEGLSAELARHVSTGVESGALEELADRMVATRRAKGFPSASELIAAVKTIPTSSRPHHVPVDKWAEMEKAEKNAIRLLRGGPLAGRAVRERWAPGLIDFTVKNGRAPCLDEEEPIVALARRNDVDARDCGMSSIVHLRRTMHETAAARLGFSDLEIPEALRRT